MRHASVLGAAVVHTFRPRRCTLPPNPRASSSSSSSSSSHSFPTYAVFGLGNPGAQYRFTRHNAGRLLVEQLARALDAPLDNVLTKYASRLSDVLVEMRAAPVPRSRASAHSPSSSLSAEQVRSQQPQQSQPQQSLPRRRLLLVTPETYMNLSGTAVMAIKTRFHLPPSHILVLYDDVHLPIGTLRITQKGSSGAHNGAADIIKRMGGDTCKSFVRIRVGIAPLMTIDDDDDNRDNNAAARTKAAIGRLADYVLSDFAPTERALLSTRIYRRVVHAIELIAQGRVERAMNLYNRPGHVISKEEEEDQELSLSPSIKRISAASRDGAVHDE